MDEILNLIEPVSEGFPSYSFYEILEYHAVDVESRLRFRGKRLVFCELNLIRLSSILEMLTFHDFKA